MTNPQRRDPDAADADTQRPKWLAWVIVVFMVMVALGVFNVGRLIMRPAAPSPAEAAKLAADPLLAQGRQLAEASSCMSCHRAERKAVGPSFVDVANRHQVREDALAYVTHKIREGSVGVWGPIVMPRQPQVSEQDAQLMARWVLSLGKPVAATAPAASASGAPASAP